jgi:branched-subunit amino acid transport protein
MQYLRLIGEKTAAFQALVILLLLMLKVDGWLTWSWAKVLAPLYVGPLLWIATPITIMMLVFFGAMLVVLFRGGR